jgi:hypothetical protein
VKSQSNFGVFELPDRPLFPAAPFANAHGLTPLIVRANRHLETGLLQMGVRLPDSDPEAICEILIRGIGCWQWRFCVELPLLGIFRRVKGGFEGHPASRLLRLEAPTIARSAI